MISIIVPVYKTEKYLKKCVDSILKSSYRDIEVVLIDDGSQDNCPAICDEFARKDARVVVLHKRNGGVASAWKAGVNIAKGEYLTFVDSDDWIDGDFIDGMLNCLLSSGVEMMCCNIVRNDAEKALFHYPYKGLVKVDDIKDRIIYYRNYHKIIPNSRYAKLYKRTLVVNAMQYCSEYVSLGDDQQLIIACLLLVKEVFVLPELVGYHYRANPNSLVNSYNSNLYNKVNNVIDAIANVCSELSDFDYRDQIDKESAMYGEMVITNAYYTQNPKEDIDKVFNDSRMMRGSQTIDYKDLTFYIRMIVKAIKKHSYIRIRFVRFIYKLRQKLKS